jgi:hypothetical protein
LKPDILKTLDNIIQRNDTAPSSVLANLLQEKTGIRISERTIRRARSTVLARHPVHETIVKTLNLGEKKRRINMANYLLNTNIHYIIYYLVMKNSGS